MALQTTRRAVPRRPAALLILLATLLAACDPGGGQATPTPAGPGPSLANTVAPSPRPSGTATAPPGPTAARPAPTVAIDLPPATTSAANPLQVTQVTQYTNTIGAFTVIGLVRNQGSTPLTDIRITAGVKDRQGVAIGTGQDLFLALVVTLPPGVAAPFAISFSTLAGEPATVDVQVQGTPAADPTPLYPPAPGLAVRGFVLGKATAGSGSILSGQVTNGGGHAARTVRVLGVAYDAQGQVVDVGKGAAAPETIPAGGTAPFQVKFRREGVPIAHFDALPVGLAAPP